MSNAPVTIYNRDRVRVAYCENAFNVGYRLQKNALWRAWFSLPLDDPTNAEIDDLYYAEIYDGDTRIDLFRVISTKTHRSNGIPVITYQCEHVLGTLMDDMLIGVFNAGPGTTAAINTVLAEQKTTNWMLNTQDFARNFLHDWEDVTLLKALFSIPTRFTADHVWTWDTTCYPWRLNLETAPSTVSAKIRYQRELKDIQKNSDARYLYTRIYPWGFGAGADQLDILTVDQMAEGRPEFTSGSVEFTVGETLTGAISGETCVVASYLLESGGWGAGDAQGPLFVTGMSGAFTDGEDLNGSAAGANCASVDLSLDHVNAEAIVTYGIIARNWEDQRYTVAANLHEQAVSRVDENATPRATYRLSAMDFNRLAETNRYVLGDLVRVYDSELSIDVSVRLTLVSKGDVEGKPGDITLQLATEDEKFVNFGDIVYADDLDGVKDGTFGRVLSTSISAGVILLSQIAGGQLGAIPSPPTIGGLYLGSDHMGYHDGTNWITYTDNTGVAQWNGIGADTAHLQWDPAGGGTLDIKSANVDISGTVTITAGVVGGFNVDPVEGLYIGAGATRVQMKPGAGIWCGATAIGDAPFSATNAGVIKAVSGTIGGFTLAATTLTGGNLTLDAGNTKITAGTGQDIVIIDAAHATYRLFVGETDPTMAPFSVTKAGVMVATQATITGTVTATAGTVGGWTLSAADGLYTGNEATRIQLKIGVGIWAGDNTFGDAPFSVDPAGALVATDATISGAVTITSGPLLGLNSGSNVLYDPGMEQVATSYWGNNGAREDAGGAAGGGNGSVYYWEMVRTVGNKIDYARDYGGGIRYIEVNPGDVWEYGIDEWSDGIANAQIRLRTYDEDKTPVAYSTALSSTTNAWTAKRGTFTIPAGVKFIAVEVIVRDANGTVGFDNCVLRQVNFTAGLLGGANAVTISSAGLNVGVSGSIMGGQTAYDTGTGFFLGYSGGAYKLSIGVAAGNKLTFDGATLAITGTVTASAGTIGGFTLSATTLANGANIVLDASNKKISINDATFENAGIQLDYNAGTPQFYVGDGANEFIMLKAGKVQWKAANSELDASGNLTVTNATVTGAITMGVGSTLSADYITAGELIGRDIKTAAAGERVGIDATSGFLGTAHRIGAHDGTRPRMLFGYGGGTWYNAAGAAVIQFSSTPVSAPLTLTQTNTSGNIPCLKLDQDDVSEGFIDFIGTNEASAAKSLSTWNSGSAIDGHFMVRINGADKWVAYRTAPTGP